MDPQSETAPASEGQVGPVPTKGRIVMYRLSQNDIESIEGRRRSSNGLLAGNPMSEGQAFPFLITQDWGGQLPNQAVNGQLFLDGNDSMWLTSRHVGEGPGTWFWPVRS